MRVLWILCLTGSIICAPVEKGLGSNGAETQLHFPWYTFRGTRNPELENSSDQAPEHNSDSSGYTNDRVQSLPLVTRYGAPAVGPAGYGAPAVGPAGYGAPAVGPAGYGAPAVGPAGYGAPAVGPAGYGAPAVGPAGYGAPAVGPAGYGAPAVGPAGYGAPAVGPAGYGAPAVGPAGYGAPAVGPAGYGAGQYQAAPVKFNSASGTSGEENKPVFSDMSDLDPVYSISSRSRYQKGRAVFAQTRYIPTESLGLSMPLFPYTSYMFAPQGNPHTVVTTVY